MCCIPSGAGQAFYSKTFLELKGDATAIGAALLAKGRL